MTNWRRSRILALAISASIATLSAAESQELIRAGIEFQVNTFTPDKQNGVSAAVDADGDFVLVWESLNQDGDSWGVFGRRFDSAGVPLADDFQVSAHTLSQQRRASAAMDSNGDFVVAFQSNLGASGYDIVARRFSASGTPVGIDFQVNAYTAGNQFNPSIAAAGDNGYLVTWDDSRGAGLSEVFARLLDASGTAVASEFQVNAFTTDNQALASVAGSPQSFVVTWESAGQDGQNRGVFARRFATDGTVQAVEFRVSGATLGDQNRPDVGMASSGAFVISWQQDLLDGQGNDVFARRFQSSGTAVSLEFRTHELTSGHQASSGVAVTSSGDFLVSWHSGVIDVMARRWNASGAPLATEFLVNTYTPGDQLNATAAVAAAERKFVVAWNSIGQDGGLDGVFAQRFNALSPLDVDGNGSTDPLTDGVLALRFLFGFTGSTLTNDAIGFGCTRCDAGVVTHHLAKVMTSGARALGDEFAVSIPELHSALRPSVASHPNGDFVVAWHDFYLGPPEIYARRFDSSGVQQGADFLVVSDNDRSYHPDVAVTPAGGFVVVWQDQNFSIRGRLFDDDGVPASASGHLGNGYSPLASVDIAANGSMVVVWRNPSGVEGRRFSSNGAGQGLNFQVSALTADPPQSDPDVAKTDSGFVVAWAGSSSRWPYALRFDSTGSPLGAELQLMDLTSSAEQALPPVIDADADGEMVVVWAAGSGPGDGNAWNIFARRLGSTGGKLGAELLVSSHTLSKAPYPAAASAPDGSFVVVWQSYESGAHPFIMGRRFSSNGVGLGGEFQVSAYTTEAQEFPSVAVGGDGFVVAWQSHTSGFEYTVRARRYAFGLLDADGDGAIRSLTDGILTLRYLFGFTDDALTAGAVGEDCTRCTPAGIESYLRSID